MINKSYKIWIMLFISINLILLVWSLGYLNFLEEKFTSKDTVGILDYEDIHKYLALHTDKVKELFAAKEEDDFKDEGVFEL